MIKKFLLIITLFFIWSNLTYAETNGNEVDATIDKIVTKFKDETVINSLIIKLDTYLKNSNTKQETKTIIFKLKTKLKNKIALLKKEKIKADSGIQTKSNKTIVSDKALNYNKDFAKEFKDIQKKFEENVKAKLLNVVIDADNIITNTEEIDKMLNYIDTYEEVITEYWIDVKKVFDKYWVDLKNNEKYSLANAYNKIIWFVNISLKMNVEHKKYYLYLKTIQSNIVIEDWKVLIDDDYILEKYNNLYDNMRASYKEFNEYNTNYDEYFDWFIKYWSNIK